MWQSNSLKNLLGINLSSHVNFTVDFQEQTFLEKLPERNLNGKTHLLPTINIINIINIQKTSTYTMLKQIAGSRHLPGLKNALFALVLNALRTETDFRTMEVPRNGFGKQNNERCKDV